MVFLRLANFEILYVIGPIFLLSIVFKLFFQRRLIYLYPLTGYLENVGFASSNYRRVVLYFLRVFVLLILMFFISRPQWVDSRSKINIEGIDIIITLDVSGSMQLFDDLRDRRPRIEVAKNEAIRFIGKRINDPIGIVVFGHDALSICPLTLDKKMLKEVVGKLKLGIIDTDATALGTGLSIAINRLKDSKSKSKIIILLTDGEPSQEKIDPYTAIDMAKKFGIKIYTIGIGNENGSFLSHPMSGIQKIGVHVNMALLKKIADDTGGSCFRANNPAEMRSIYDKIDLLEKTEYESDIFQNFHEVFFSFIWILLIFFSAELFLRFFVWRGF